MLLQKFIQFLYWVKLGGQESGMKPRAEYRRQRVASPGPYHDVKQLYYKLLFSRQKVHCTAAS